jgi:hypothetical protein
MADAEKPPLPPTMIPADIAQGIAKDAQEHLGGLDVISVGPIFADEYAGDRYLQLYAVLPNREGDNFVTKLVTLAYVQDTLVAQINRTTLNHGARTDFGRVQIFSDEPAFAKYCQKQWPNQRMDQGSSQHHP